MGGIVVNAKWAALGISQTALLGVSHTTVSVQFEKTKNNL